MRTIRRKGKRTSASYGTPAPSPYSATGEANRDAVLELLDELPLWQAELVWEYGTAKALNAVRLHPTPERARAALEAQRLRNEELRWANGGRLPPGY